MTKTNINIGLKKKQTFFSLKIGETHESSDNKIDPGPNFLLRACMRIWALDRFRKFMSISSSDQIGPAFGFIL
jgi:hypothetical protein